MNPEDFTLSQRKVTEKRKKARNGNHGSASVSVQRKLRYCSRTRAFVPLEGFYLRRPEPGQLLTRFSHCTRCVTAKNSPVTLRSRYGPGPARRGSSGPAPAPLRSRLPAPRARAGAGAAREARGRGRAARPSSTAWGQRRGRAAGREAARNGPGAGARRGRSCGTGRADPGLRSAPQRTAGTGPRGAALRWPGPARGAPGAPRGPRPCSPCSSR